MRMKNGRHDKTKEAERRNTLPWKFSVQVLSSVFQAVMFLNKFPDMLEQFAHLTASTRSQVDIRTTRQTNDLLRTFCPDSIYLFPELLTPVYQLFHALLNVFDALATACRIYFNGDLFGTQAPKDTSNTLHQYLVIYCWEVYSHSLLRESLFHTRSYTAPLF